MQKFLVLMFRHSVDEADMPLSLRGNDKPYLQGEADICASYRPVALTLHIAKQLERILRPQLLDFLEKRGLLDNGQHGGCLSKSTLTQLLHQYERMIDMLMEDENIEILIIRRSEDTAPALDRTMVSMDSKSYI